MSEPSSHIGPRRSSFPPPQRPEDRDHFVASLNQILANDFLLEPLGHYTLFTEGTSDIEYIRLASDAVKKAWGIDLLTVPKEDLEYDIEIRSPKNPQRPDTGGVPALVRLASELSRWKTRMELPALAFLFDHDTAGKEGRSKALASWGDKDTCITLDPSQHPTCSLHKDRDEIDIEDLVDLGFQVRFFESLTAATGWVHYKNGHIAQIQWEYPSKEEFRQHTSGQATVVELLEIARIVVRVREAWGVPVVFPPPNQRER